MDDAREEARRWVRRKRRFFTIVVIYLALSVLWFAIDMLTGTDDLWFFWPMLGAGLIVAVIGIAMFGIGGLFGAGWERREVEKYIERRGGGQSDGNAQAEQRPPSDTSPS
jgi:polyferredoxin